MIKYYDVPAVGIQVIMTVAYITLLIHMSYWLTWLFVFGVICSHVWVISRLWRIKE